MGTSIIIITYNGQNRLPRLLNSINSLSETDFEVVIVDDGSVESPLELIESLDLKYTYKFIRQENKGRAGAKNTGVENSSFEWLWFLDDDMRVQSDSLTAHRRHLIEFPDTVSVGTTFEEKEESDTDIQKYRCFISDIWQKALEELKNPLQKEDLFLASANFSISKKLFLSLGGFADNLRDAEDLDLAYRCYLANVPVYYNLAAVGYHKDKITCRSYVQRNRQYLKGYEILKTRSPHYLDINKRMELVKVNDNRKWLLGIIGQPLFVYLVDHFNVFMLLPRSIRYRFYEQLILSLGRVYVDRKLFGK